MHRARRPRSCTSRARPPLGGAGQGRGAPIVRGPGSTDRAGFTLIEVLMVVVILGVLSAFAIPQLQRAIDRANIAHAIGDIKAIQTDIMTYMADNQDAPDGLWAVGREGMLDPWGEPYVYARLGGKGAKARKDKFLVPLNSDFDLYSKGKDGASVAPLTAKASRDDIVRANDGGFVGLAEEF